MYVDVQGSDIGGHVRDAKRVIMEKLQLPLGYRLEWSGRFESLERATQRLRVVIPITLLIIVSLLHLDFRSVIEVGIVMLSLPFALVGRVWMMWLLDYNMSVAVAIGFIALTGVAAETGVMMLLCLDQSWNDCRARGEMQHRVDVDAAIQHGAVERVRPKMMTMTAIIAGLVPILWSRGTGADVMKRIAAPMVSGILTSIVLTLIVIPAIYSLWKEHEVRCVLVGVGADESALAIRRSSSATARSTNET